MEIIGGCIIAACLWYTQSKPAAKKEESKKKPDITVEIYDHRKRDATY